MAYSESQNKATQKYISNNYDQISIRIPKGKRDAYRAYAEAQGTSLNKLIVDLIEADMAKRGR